MRLFITLCLCLGAGLLAAEEQQAVQLPAPGDSYEIIGIVPGLEKFVIRYDDKLIRGGQPLAIEGGQAWKQWGVKTVVSVCPTDLERLLCQQTGIKLVELPYEKATVKADTIARFIEVAKTCKKPMYVHCHGGTHRGGGLCLAYRLAIDGMDKVKALAEYEALGGAPASKDKPIVDAIDAYLKQ